MGTKHETDSNKINQIGDDIAKQIERAGSNESLSNIFKELDSYDKQTQLAVARAAFSANQDHVNKHLTNVQLEIVTENVQKAGMPKGEPWLHSLSAEMNMAKKPTDWKNHPIDSLGNSIDNLFTPDRKMFPIFEESKDEHDNQIKVNSDKPFRSLDIDAGIAETKR